MPRHEQLLDLIAHVAAPARFHAGMLHNLIAAMYAAGENREAIELLVELVCDAIEEHQP